MSFLVVTDGNRNLTLFLVDRSKDRFHWWSYDINKAIIFERKGAALMQAAKYKFKNPRVVGISKAREMEEKNKQLYRLSQEIKANRTNQKTEQEPKAPF